MPDGQKKAWEELFQVVEELNTLLRGKGDDSDAFEAYCSHRVNQTVTGRWVVDYAGIIRDLRADQQDEIADQWLASKTKWWKSRNLSARPVGSFSKWQPSRETDGTLTVTAVN